MSVVAKKKGRPKNPPKFKEILNELIPAADIFKEDEIKMYQGLVSLYMKDFDESQLTANDLDDIMSIAMNRVLEIRLLKSSKDNSDMQLDSSNAIEKLRKQTEKLKDSLAARRKDRIDPKKYSGFSIVDLAMSFDKDRRQKMIDKSLEFSKEDEKLSKSKLLVGNREDADVKLEQGISSEGSGE